MKTLLSTRPVTRRVLNFTVGLMAGLLTFSAAQFIHDADLTPGPRTVHLSTTVR